MKKNIGFIDVKPLKFKDNAFAAFKNYKALCENQFGYQLQNFHTNGRREYMEEFEYYLQEKRISYEITTFYSPEQN